MLMLAKAKDFMIKRRENGSLLRENGVLIPKLLRRDSPFATDSTLASLRPSMTPIKPCQWKELKHVKIDHNRSREGDPSLRVNPPERPQKRKDIL